MAGVGVGVSPVFIPVVGGVSNPDYFVSSTGSDANDGLTAATPWLTISKVLATTFTAGDFIAFKGGETFSGELTLDNAKHYGDANGSIVFGSYGSGMAIIDAPTDADNGVLALNAEYLTIKDLKFTGTGDTVSTSKGVWLTNNQAGHTKLAGVVLQNLDISGFGVDGIRTQTTHASASSGWDGLIIRDCVIYDCTANAGTSEGCGIFIEGQYGAKLVPYTHTNLLITGCVVHDCDGKAATAKHTGNGILVAETDGGLVTNCLAYDNGLNGNACVGIWCFDSNDITFEYCEVYGQKTNNTTDGGGFDLDGGTTNSVIQFCYAHDNHGSGFQIFQYWGSGYIKAMENNHIRYNISENNCINNPSKTGAFLISNGEDVDQPNNYVYNNAIFQDKANSTGLQFVASSYNHRMINSGFMNNIIFIDGSGSNLVNTEGTGNNVPPSSFDIVGNVYHTTGSFSIDWNGSTYTSMAAWRSASSQETLSAVDTSVVGDPLYDGTIPVANLTTIFDVAELFPYKVGASSPALNAGVDIETEFSIDAGSQDIFGNQLSSITFDIGVSRQTEDA